MNQAETMKTGIENHFPFEFIEDDFLISNQGAVAAGFLVDSMPEAGGMSESQLEGVHYALVQALSSLPNQTIMQKTDVFFEGVFKAKSEGHGYLGKRWMEHFNYRPALHHKVFVFLIFQPAGTARTGNAANSGFARRKKISDPFPNHLQDLNRLCSDSESATSAFCASLSMWEGIRLRRLGSVDLESTVNAYMNLDFSCFDLGCEPAVKAMSNEKGDFMIGREHVSAISMTGQGSEVQSSCKDFFNVHSNMISPVLAELDFAHVVSQSVCICDTQVELRRLDSMRSMLNAFSGQRNQDGEIQELGIQNLSAEIRSKGFELVKFCLQVFVFDSDPAALGRKTDRAYTALRSIQGIKACLENYDTANLFMGSIPGNAMDNYRWILMPSVNAACYIPFQKYFTGESSGILLCDRYRQPVHVNFWNESLDNKNKLVIGPSGSGKSFTVNSFITQHFHDGDDVIIIDVGGSYKALFQVMEGKYIEYRSGRPLRFNPFYCTTNEQGEYEPGQEKLNFLISLLVILWKNQGEHISKAEKAVLTRTLTGFYKNISARASEYPADRSGSKIPSLNSFYEYLQTIDSGGDDSYLDLKGLILVLRDYTRTGNRPELLNANEEADISDNRLVCFDMNGIREDETLFPIVSLLIIDLVLEKIKRFPEKRKHIYMDEAWSMLKESLGDFVMNMFRTIRKSNGAITIITQGITEIQNSAVGAAILQNAATKILLDHSSASQFYEILRITLGLTSHEMDLLQSLRKNDKEGWREFFVKFGSEARVLMLEAPAEARIAFDSRILPRERLRLKNESCGGNIGLAIDELIREERRVNHAG